MKLYQQQISSVKEAYGAIHDFFSCYHLHEALEEVDRLFDWATRKKYYKQSAPADIIFCVQQLHGLFFAAEIINYSTGKRFSAILLADVQEALTAHYSKAGPHCTPWQCFPRHLTSHEYLNPYWALKKLSGIPGWDEVLQELMEAALSNGSIDGMNSIAEVMKWKNNMLAVIEGGWLLEVRRN